MGKGLYKEKGFFSNLISSFGQDKKETEKNNSSKKQKNSNFVPNFIKSNNGAYSVKKFIDVRLDVYELLIFRIQFGEQFLKIIGSRIEYLHEKIKNQSLFSRIFNKKLKYEYDFLTHMYNKMDNGVSFSESTKGWVTTEEQMLITASEGSSIEASLRNVINLMKELKEIKTVIMKNFIVPIIMVIIGHILVFVTAYFIHPAINSVSPVKNWTGISMIIEYVRIFVQDYFIYYVLFIIGFIAFYKYSLNNIVSGKFRAFLDRRFIWDVYREIQSNVFLISLSALLSSQEKLTDSLIIISENSGKYTSHHVKKILDRETSGNYKSSEAIATEFTKNNGEDIKALSESGGFVAVVEKISSIVIGKLSTKLAKVSKIMSLLIMAFVLSLLFTIYGSFFSIVLNMYNQTGNVIN